MNKLILIGTMLLTGWLYLGCANAYDPAMDPTPSFNTQVVPAGITVYTYTPNPGGGGGTGFSVSF